MIKSDSYAVMLFHDYSLFYLLKINDSVALV